MAVEIVGLADFDGAGDDRHLELGWVEVIGQVAQHHGRPTDVHPGDHVHDTDRARRGMHRHILTGQARAGTAPDSKTPEPANGWFSPCCTNILPGSVYGSCIVNSGYPPAGRLAQTATRRPELTVFAVATTLRLVVGWVVIFLGLQRQLAPDTRNYQRILRELVSEEGLSGQGRGGSIYRESPALFYPLELIAWSPQLVTPFSLVLTAAAGGLLAALVTRLLLAYTSVAASVVGGLIIAVMPSQIIWSSMLLKDPYIAAAIAAVALALRWWCKQTSAPTFLAGFAIIVGLLAYISGIRSHTMTAVLIGTVLALLIAAPNRRALRSGLALACLLLIPWISGSGIASIEVLSNLDGDMPMRRTQMAQNANTAVIPLPENTQATIAPDPPQPTWVQDLNYLPSGIKVMTIDPMPWHLSISRSLIPAFAEHLIWYPLLAFAAVGIITRRRWTIDLVFAALMLGGLTVMWGLTEGNFGTAFRHRTEFVWIVVIFAVLGFEYLRKRRQQSRDDPTSA